MSDSLDLSACLEAAEDAARRGAAVLEGWRDKFRIREKGPADLVTEADFESQQAVRDCLLGRFSGHLFLGEEDLPGVARPTFDELRAGGCPPAWVVDPLDGTANYAHDCPGYCVSIGLWAGGRLAVGVVYDPRLGEMFAAAAGRGAALNGRPMRATAAGRLDEVLLSTGFPADKSVLEMNLRQWARFGFLCQGLRRTGSTALNLAYVAAGRYGGYWAFQNKPWDVAAGALLVAEAGGVVTNVGGGPAYDPFAPDIVAAGAGLHAAMLAEFHQ